MHSGRRRAVSADSIQEIERLQDAIRQAADLLEEELDRAFLKNKEVRWIPMMFVLAGLLAAEWKP